MEKQLCTYAIAGILREESDEDHAIRSSEIIKKLERQYEMKIGRHKLYSTIQQLRKLGEDIVYDPHSKGYYMASRQLTKGEVFMLCNAIHASNFITREQSELLIDHLLKILNKHDRREYTDSVFKPNPKKFDNLSQGESYKKRISLFLYQDHDENGRCSPNSFSKDL